MELEGPPEAEREPSLQELAESVGRDVKEVFGFKAPMVFEVKPSKGTWTAKVGERPNDPYRPESEPIRVTLYDPIDPEKQQEFRTQLPFVLRHELAHMIPLPSKIEYVAFPGRDALDFGKSHVLTLRAVSGARWEIIADILAVRASQAADQSVPRDVLAGYLNLIDRFDRPHTREAARYQDILRGQAVMESLAERDLLTTDQLHWLDMWQRRAEEVLHENFSPGDETRYKRARAYCRQSVKAAWFMDLRPEQGADEQPEH